MKRTLFKLRTIFILSIILCVHKAGIQQSFAQQTNIDSFISVLKMTKADTNRVNVLSKLCNAIYFAEPYKAIEYANQGLTLSEKISYKKGSRNFLLLLGNTYCQVGKNDTAMMYFEKIYKTLDEKKDVKEIATISNNMGLVNLHLGRIGKALDLITKANGIYKSLNEESLFANGCSMLGSIYENQGEFTKALENYLKALKIYENEHNEHDIGITLLNLSSVYRCMKQYDKAKDYALEAKLKLEKANDYSRVGVALYKLALIYAEEKKYDDSNYYLYEAERIFEDAHSSYYLTLVKMLLGSNLDDKGDHDSAINYYKDALAASQQTGEIQLIAALNGNIGIVLMGKGDYFKALEYIYKSEKLLTEINDRSLLLDITPIFIEIYSQLNKPDSVSKYFQRYQVLSDSLFSEQNSKSIAEMQTKYETEKKEKEIIALSLGNEKKKNNILLLSSLNEIANLKLQNSTIENKKNIQLLKLANTEGEKQQAEIEIYKLNEEKQIKAIQDEKDKKQRATYYFIIGIVVLAIIALLGFLSFKNKKEKEKAELSRQVSENDMKALRSQINPHFVFNCVHTIQSLLNHAKIDETKTYLEKFSTLTRSVLENSKKREIPLEKEIETLKIYMELENLRFRNPFTYSINIESGIDPETILIPPLILQPFVENSIKHGFRDTEKSGHLKIEVRKENELLVCIIEDNGIGRKESIKIKPSGYKKESKGMKLTEERLFLISEIKKIKSYFLVEDLEDTLNKPVGTRIKVFLPYELFV